MVSDFWLRRQKFCNKARARILENLHYLPFLRAYSAERFFRFRLPGKRAVTCEAIWPLGRRRQRPLSATQSPALRLKKFRETALFSVSNGEQAVCWRISEPVDSAQLTQTSVLTPFRPVPGVRIPLPPPSSLDYRESRSQSPQNQAKWPQFRKSCRKPDWRKYPTLCRGRALPCLSLEAKFAVRLPRIHEANGMRSQTDDSAKPLWEWTGPSVSASGSV
jgi:hypothetical protein